ncbi:MAG: hypothetical protein N2170_00335 [Bacteroidia bacterium]|nr:hypothetical protein [Bacteroidia bacterium]
MLGVALIIAAIFLYKAYKLTLKESQRLRQLQEDNLRLREEVEQWKAKYEALLDTSSPSSVREEDAPERKIRRLAERIEGRKSPLL